MSEWNLLWRCVFCELQSINLSQRRQIINSWLTRDCGRSFLKSRILSEDVWTVPGTERIKNLLLLLLLLTCCMLNICLWSSLIWDLNFMLETVQISSINILAWKLKVVWLGESLRWEGRIGRIGAGDGGWWPEARGRDVRLLRLFSPARIMDREGGANEELPVEKISTMCCWSVLTRRH